MALIRYVSGLESQQLYFAIVADDTKAEFVWPMDDEDAAWFESDERIAMLLAFESQLPPTDALGWIELASQHLGDVSFADEDTPDFKTGCTSALRRLVELSAPSVNPSYSPEAGSASAAWDEVVQSYPEFGESDAEGNEVSPEAMLHWVLHTLGPIDPEGPNGWILRAADGEPRPGDENSYVHYNLPPYTEVEQQPSAAEAPSE